MKADCFLLVLGCFLASGHPGPVPLAQGQKPAPKQPLLAPEGRKLASKNAERIKGILGKLLIGKKLFAIYKVKDNIIALAHILGPYVHISFKSVMSTLRKNPGSPKAGAGLARGGQDPGALEVIQLIREQSDEVLKQALPHLLIISKELYPIMTPLLARLLKMAGMNKLSTELDRIKNMSDAELKALLSPQNAQGAASLLQGGPGAPDAVRSAPYQTLGQEGTFKGGNDAARQSFGPLSAAAGTPNSPTASVYGFQPDPPAPGYNSQTAASPFPSAATQLPATQRPRISQVPPPYSAPPYTRD